MELGDKFEFSSKNYDKGTLGTAEKLPSGDFLVSRGGTKSGPLTYSRVTVEGLIKSGVWACKNTANGVGKDGKPMFFDKSMLKVGMRFKTANGYTWIVMEDVQGGSEKGMLIGVRKDGWTVFRINTEDKLGYDAVEVFNVPTNNSQLLAEHIYEDLVWKYTPTKSKEQQELEDKILLCEGNLTSHKATYERSLMEYNEKKSELEKLIQQGG